MSDYTTLLEATGDDVANNGIFAFIRNSLSSVPDYLSDIVSLNLAYYYNHSGNKIISPLVKNQLGDNTTLDNTANYNLARIIVAICKPNWDYEYKALFSDYDPIENYNSTETETINQSGSESNTGTDNNTRTGTDTTTKSGSDTTAYTGTDKKDNTGTVTDTNTNENGTSTTDNKIYGFNSDSASDDTTSTTTVNQTITDERTDNLSESTTYGRNEAETIDISDTTTYNTSDNRTLNLSKNTSGDTTRNLTRHGNIGVTTSQQMIESELILREKFFFEIIFKDIDKYLTLAVY